GRSPRSWGSRGVDVGPVELVLAPWTSPGSVTERLYCYAAPYTPADRTGDGGGWPRRARTSVGGAGPAVRSGRRREVVVGQLDAAGLVELPGDELLQRPAGHHPHARHAQPDV